MPPESDPVVHVVLLGSTTASEARKVAFHHQVHAETLAEQWAKDRNRPTAVEAWSSQRWQESGGGWALLREVPLRQRVFSMGPKAWTPDGREARSWFSDFEGWSWAYEFETDSYTDAPAVSRVEFRPGLNALTEATARGTHEQAVRDAFARACAQAQATCGESPYRDLWEEARNR